MTTVNVDPNEIRHAEGQMIAVWPVIITSQSLHDYGEETVHEDKAIIPPQFANIVSQAITQNRALRITFLPVLGFQTASSVQII